MRVYKTNFRRRRENFFNIFPILFHYFYCVTLSYRKKKQQQQQKLYVQQCFRLDGFPFSIAKLFHWRNYPLEYLCET